MALEAPKSTMDSSVDGAATEAGAGAEGCSCRKVGAGVNEVANAD